MNLDEFTYKIIDSVNGKEYTCSNKDCKANFVTGKPKALSFSFDTDFSVPSGKCEVTYPKIMRKKARRILASADSYSFVIDGISLTARSEKGAKDQAKNGHIAVNAIRFFSTIWLAILGSPHTFWATNLFSWIQVFAFLRGPYLADAEQYISPHQKWFILAADFGDPFKTWNNWDNEDRICRAGTEYPFNKFGCSFTDTFGQNFIVMLGVLLFCLILSAVVLIRRARNNKNKVEPKGSESREKKADNPTWLDKVCVRLGYWYYLRWVQALQPSILFFSLLDFRTSYTQSRLAFGTFLSAMFFLYYLTCAVLTIILAVKVWRSPNRANEDSACLETLALKEGGMFRWLSFQYCDMKVPAYFFQMLNPTVDFLRTLIFAAFLVGIDNSQISLGMIFFVELIRFVFQQLHFTKKKNLYFSIMDVLVGVLMFLYLIVKLSTTTSGKLASSVQDAGKGIAGLIVLFWIVVMVDIIYSTVLAIIAIVRGQSSVQQAGFSKAPHQEHTTTMNNMTEFNDTNKLNMNSTYRLDVHERVEPNQHTGKKEMTVKAELGRDMETPGPLFEQRNAYRMEH